MQRSKFPDPPFSLSPELARIFGWYLEKILPLHFELISGHATAQKKGIWLFPFRFFKLIQKVFFFVIFLSLSSKILANKIIWRKSTLFGNYQSFVPSYCKKGQGIFESHTFHFHFQPLSTQLSTHSLVAAMIRSNLTSAGHIQRHQQTTKEMCWRMRR